MRYFCQYWKNEAEEHNREGTLLKYSFSSQFSKRGIQPGDAVYVVTVKAGELYLVGKMLVAGVGFREIAVRLKGRDAFLASP